MRKKYKCLKRLYAEHIYYKFSQRFMLKLTRKSGSRYTEARTLLKRFTSTLAEYCISTPAFHCSCLG